MSNCLGVGAISLTTDKFIILMKRAQWTGESPNQIDRPGGHPEPDLVLGHNDTITQQKSNCQDLDFQIYNELTNEKVLEEVFQSPQNELRDEINIPMEQQSDPLLLGTNVSFSEIMSQDMSSSGFPPKNQIPRSAIRALFFLWETT